MPTVLDVERLARLLRRTSEDLQRLRSVDRSALPDDEVVLDHVKYRFVTAIEAAIDVAQHVCATEGWSTPPTNAEALRELHRRGVLDEPTGSGMARAVGFRNVLVHRYAEVDDRLVVAQLDHLAVLESFVQQVTAQYL
jgi:uncharacterized protein YutE (UPF0331/DUF86 family)